MSFWNWHSPNWASQVAQLVKNLTALEGDIKGMDSIPGSGRSPGEGNGNPVFSLGKSHGQRSLWAHE